MKQLVSIDADAKTKFLNECFYCVLIQKFHLNIEFDMCLNVKYGYIEMLTIPN